MGICGGWQLAYRKDEKGDGGVKRIFLHQEGGPGSRHGSVLPLSGGVIPDQGEFIHAAALVSQSVLHPDKISSQCQIGEALDKKIESAAKGSSWRELFEPGVKHALFVGIGIKIFNSFHASMEFCATLRFRNKLVWEFFFQTWRSVWILRPFLYVL